MHLGFCRRGRREDEPLRVVFVGQAVERKGLPVLLRAFEALREQIPATLTLVGAVDAGAGNNLTLTTTGTGHGIVLGRNAVTAATGT